VVVKFGKLKKNKNGFGNGNGNGFTDQNSKNIKVTNEIERNGNKNSILDNIWAKQLVWF
jgi:hypothetical protein